MNKSRYEYDPVLRAKVLDEIIEHYSKSRNITKDDALRDRRDLIEVIFNENIKKLINDNK